MKLTHQIIKPTAISYNKESHVEEFIISLQKVLNPKLGLG